MKSLIVSSIQSTASYYVGIYCSRDAVDESGKNSDLSTTSILIYFSVIASFYTKVMYYCLSRGVYKPFISIILSVGIVIGFLFLDATYEFSLENYVESTKEFFNRP